MGGNALKITKTRRYNRDEFILLEKNIVDTLSKTFKVHPTTYFKSKETFGDMDILVYNDGINFNIKSYIQETFSPNEIVANSNVYSFNYDELQIDLIFITSENWESAKTYFSYNDLHNFIGKIAHQFGLKWGMDGLKWVNKSGDKIYLTKDYRLALPFLGFDLEVYETGFNSLEEIFNFIRTSKYYNPYYFDFELMNRVNRERDSKRTTYLKFIEFIANDKNQIDTGYKFFRNKEFYYGHINLYFPHFYNEYQTILDRELIEKKLKSKFNGNIVMEYYKSTFDLIIEGKELGIAMNKFKNSFNSVFDYEDYVLNTSSNEILNKFYSINNDNKLNEKTIK